MSSTLYLIPWAFNLYALLLIWQLVKVAGTRNPQGVFGYTLALVNMIGWYATTVAFMAYVTKSNAILDAILDAVSRGVPI